MREYLYFSIFDASKENILINIKFIKKKFQISIATEYQSIKTDKIVPWK